MLCPRPLAPCLGGSMFYKWQLFGIDFIHIVVPLSFSLSLSLSLSPYMSLLYAFCVVHGSCSSPGECVCDPGYSGTLCDIDDDVCGHQSPCMNNGTCSNTGPDSHTCDCPPQFSGPNCESDVDECTSINPCLNEATCVVSH